MVLSVQSTWIEKRLF